MALLRRRRLLLLALAPLLISSLLASTVGPAFGSALVGGEMASEAPHGSPPSPPLAVAKPAGLPPPAAGAVGPSAQWPMFLHDLQRTGGNLNESTIASSNASLLAPIWTYNTTGGVSGSIVVVNGTAYFGAWDGDLYAVNVYNGSLEWKTPLPGRGDYTGCGEPGIAGTPAVWNDTVYIGGGNTYLYAVATANGSVLWHLDLANLTGSSSPWTAHKIWSSPAVYNGSLYIGIASGCDSPLVRGALFQIGLANRTIDHIFWTLPSGQIGPGIWSSPSIDPASNTVWATTGNEWVTDTKYARSVVELNASNVSELLGYAQRSPAFVDYDFGDGATLFHATDGTPMAVAVNKNGVAYAFNESALQANGLSPNAWTISLTPFPGNSLVPPAFDGRYLYFGTVGTRLPDGSSVAGSVLCVEPDNGTTRWWVGLSSAIYGGITFANGLVVVGLTGGGVEVLDALNGDELFSATTGNVWGEPTVVNGELLVASGNIYGGWNGGGTVQAFALPLASTSTATIVPGQRETTYAFNTTIAGGISPYTVAWLFGDGFYAFGGATSHAYVREGPYNVTCMVTDASGSTFTNAFSIVAFAPLDLVPTINVNPVNLGGATWINVTVQGGAAPFTYAWHDLPPGSPFVSSTTSQILALPSAEGEYNFSVEVNGTLGQSNTANYTLWVDGPATLALLASPSVGPPPLTVTFQVLSSYPFTSAQFDWQFGDGGGSAVRTPSHTYTASNRYVVDLTVGYPGGTQSGASIVVVVVDPLTLSAPSSASTELGRSVTLNASATGGLTPYTYAWHGLPAPCVTQNSSQLTCMPTATGAFAVVVDVSDVLGSAESTNLLLVVADRPSVQVVVESNQPIGCADPFNASVRLAATASGGIPPFAFAWTGPEGSVRSGANSAWTVRGPGPLSFTVVASDTIGGSANATVAVTTGTLDCGGSAHPAGYDLAVLLEIGAGAIALALAGAIAVVWLRRRRRR